MENQRREFSQEVEAWKANNNLTNGETNQGRRI